MKLKELLETIEAKETVDICVPPSSGDTKDTPRTIFYGSAREAYNCDGGSLPGYFEDTVEYILTYIDNLEADDEKLETEFSVLMIYLPENREKK